MPAPAGGSGPTSTYATAAELKRMLRITDTADDTDIQNALVRASRAIDKRCGRRFYQDTATSARTYRVADRIVRDTDGELLVVDDIATASGLTVEIGNGSSWTAYTAYFTEPDNAVTRGEAITGLRRDLGCWSINRRARVTANWGWPAVPDPIVEATLLLANRRFKRRESPEGVAGWAQEGPIRVSRFDPDIEDLVTSYVIVGFG